MNPKFKSLLDDTPAWLSGSIILVALLGMLVVVFQFGSNPKTTYPILISTCIGGLVAYKVFRAGKLVLDKQRTVTGKLAKAIGIVGAILALVSGYFFAIAIYSKFVV